MHLKTRPASPIRVHPTPLHNAHRCRLHADRHYQQYTQLRQGAAAAAAAAGASLPSCREHCFRMPISQTLLLIIAFLQQ